MSLLLSLAIASSLQGGAEAADGFVIERFHGAAWSAGDGRTRAIVVVDRPWSYDEAAAFAAQVGAQLAPASSPELLDFIGSLCDLEGAFDCDGPWIGGARPALGSWMWSDGSTFRDFGFAEGRPAQASVVPAALLLSGVATPNGGLADGTWLDALPGPDAGTKSRAAALSWSSLVDCDQDGRPDALEIAADASLDANTDGVLDSCKDNPADLDGDGTVGAGDLAVLLDAWGDKGAPGTLPADLTGDGRVDAADLSALLTAWGAGA